MRGKASKHLERHSGLFWSDLLSRFRILSKRRCRHCGKKISLVGGTGAFCCSGCEQVHRLIRSEGLDTFYDLRIGSGRPVIDPISETAEAFEWAESYPYETEEDGGRSMRLKIDGMHCPACAWLIEQLFKRVPGGERIQIHTEAHAIAFHWHSDAFEVRLFLRLLRDFGYYASPFPSSIRASWSSLAWRVTLCAIFAMNTGLLVLSYPISDGFAYGGLFDLLGFLFALLSLLVGGSYFMVPSFQALRAGRLHYDLPCALGLCLMPFVLWRSGWMENLWKWSFVVFVLIAGRWCHRHLFRGVENGLNDAGTVHRRYIRMRRYVCGTLALIAFVSFYVWGIRGAAPFDRVVSALIAATWYPFPEVSGRDGPIWFSTVGLSFCFGGVLFGLFGLLGPVSAAVWVSLGGIFWGSLGVLIFGRDRL